MARFAGDDERLVEGDPGGRAAALQRVPRSRVVHEDVAHHPGTDRKEMRAVVPRHALDVDQAEVRLVDQRRRLEAVPRVLASRVSPGDLVEFPMYERNQLLQGPLVALPPSEQQAGDFRRAGS